MILIWNGVNPGTLAAPVTAKGKTCSRRSRPRSAPANPTGDDRVELRHADRRGKAAVPDAIGRDDEQFQRLVQQSADYARKAGDSWALLMALNNLGLVAFNAGDLQRAGSFLDEAPTIARSSRDRRSEAFVLSNLGLLELERGNTNEARRTVASSLRLAQQLRFLAIAASDLMLLAAVAVTQHEPELAAQLLGGADRVNEEIGAANDALEDEVRTRTVAMIQQEIPPDRYIDALQQGYRQDVDTVIEHALAHLG